MTSSVVDVHTHSAPHSIVDRFLSGEVVCPGVQLHLDGDAVLVEVAHRDGPSEGMRRFHLARSHYDLEARLPEIDRMGVDVQILSPLPYLYGHWLDPETGDRWCRLFNDAMADAIGLYPSRFRYLAGLPMQDARLAALEMDRTLTTSRAVGVAVATRVGAAYLDDLRFTPFWETADALGAWVLLHPAVEVAGPPAMRPYYLTNLVGHPVETALAAARLMLSGVLIKYPRVRLCLAHGGGVLPLLVGRLAHGSRVRNELGALLGSVRDLYRRFYFDSVTHDPDALAYLVRTVGARHVCLGSDFPADMADLDPLETIRRAPGLTDQERAQILSAHVLTHGAARRPRPPLGGVEGIH
jgi:aminocarboxymuconate-semialdehyde decarboxylase